MLRNWTTEATGSYLRSNAAIHISLLARNRQGYIFAAKLTLRMTHEHWLKVFWEFWRKCVGIEPTRDSSNRLSPGLKPEPVTRQISLPQ